MCGSNNWSFLVYVQHEVGAVRAVDAADPTSQLIYYERVAKGNSQAMSSWSDADIERSDSVYSCELAIDHFIFTHL